MITKEKKIEQNIILNPNLLNNYANLKEIFQNENWYFLNIINLKDIHNLMEYDIANLSYTEIYHFAKKIFVTYHYTNEFFNYNYKIIVSNTDIKESINKIINNKLQYKYLRIHLIIFSQLGFIIQNATIVNQTIDNKNRNNNYLWSYYLCKLKLNNELFLFEFDVISKSNGENHYRVQRVEKKQILSSGST